MSGADKARFYLEQSVPELHELERKELFSRDEITAIAKKRSEFEHIVNGRGTASPSDFARYAEYEMNLESLRKKRAKRMGVKAGGHSGQRRIMFILDRATRKFHGDIALWFQYLSYLRSQKSTGKKMKEVLTSVLRMHPTKPDLWVWGARTALDADADMTSARAYMQRGLRFCKNSRQLWLEYAKLEMIYVAKIAARRQILGLDQERKKKEDAAEDPDADMIALPDITAEDINPSLAKDDGVDEVALQNLANTPVLQGAIPRAIFDEAMKQFQNDPKLAEQFFDMFAEFNKTPCTKTLLQYIVDTLNKRNPTALSTQICNFKLPLFGLETTSPEFPSALGKCLQSIKASLQQSQQTKHQLAEQAIMWILPILQAEDLDDGLRKVLSASLRQYVRSLQSEDQLAGAVAALQQANRTEDARTLVECWSRQWPGSERLLQAQASLAV
ncbi:RNA-processing protein HAT helix [Lasiodiplodia theobromae]|uniref:U3 small nucleolar RNA-associated protein 6 n=1 Tax=Lasiodiplodia theobromae TaxID=45133 RepID=A0A5N5DEU0_9PEZI|nr:rRNA processing protein utp6 [Lasiodiplodia theobromae]KAB2576319.1 U3 small nucleolar RNA-associated protein 6 [Lasiodiplodia theobromae]KAF4533927.1 rRNA processing protein utp6 [Lasiodiplodia theobromae]KAF9638215.1 RNA-processing protein HAT helix [Lasiodiplodia theobromae]